jgi:hypothetical protein
MRPVHVIAAAAATVACLIVATGVALAADSGPGQARSPAVHKPVRAPTANLNQATPAVHTGDETVDEQQDSQREDEQGQADTPNSSDPSENETDDPSESDTPDPTDTSGNEIDDASETPESDGPEPSDGPDPGEGEDSATQ